MRVIAEGPIGINRRTITEAWPRRAADTRLVIHDAGCRGLALVVNPTSMAWRFDYRPRGADPATGRRWPNWTVIIGRPDTVGPEAARQEAQRLKGIVAGGGDPAEVQRMAVRRATDERANTLGRLADEYAVVFPKRPKLRGAGAPSPGHVGVELRALRAAIAEMDAAELPAAQLTPPMIRRMLAALGAHPSGARARFGALSRFCDWLMDDELIGANPCQLLGRASRPKAPAGRSEYLAPAQLATLWHAAVALDPVRRDFARFLIAVPCRRGEATSLDWRHLDLAASAWSQPDRLTKNREPHRVYLHPLALGVLRARHDAAGRPSAGLVFPAPRSLGEMTTWRRVKAELVTASGLDGWRFHDMRRSFATALGEAGVPEPVVDAVLNHRQSATRSGVLGTYQRATRWPEQTAAMQRWGSILAKALAAFPMTRPGEPADDTAPPYRTARQSDSGGKVIRLRPAAPAPATGAVRATRGRPHRAKLAGDPLG